MKKHAFWWQIFIATLITIGGIVLIIFGITKDIPTEGAASFGFIMIVLGIWDFVTIHKIQKKFKEHFERNERDKKEIEELKKIYEKHE